MSEAPMAPDWQVSRWFNSPTSLNLTQLQGKVVLLHVFRMLCSDCVSHAVPQAERVHREYAGAGVAVIGLYSVFESHAAMTLVALEAFLREHRITHPVGVDVADEDDPVPVTIHRYGIHGTPSLMLIDRVGRLRLHECGRVDDLRLGMEIGRLLAEVYPAPETARLADTNARDGRCDG